MTSNVRHVRRISNPCCTIAIWADNAGKRPTMRDIIELERQNGSKQDGAEQNAAGHQHVYQQPCVRLCCGGEQQTGPEAADDGNPVEQPLDNDRSQPPYPRQSKGFLEEFSAKELAKPRRHDGIEPVADEQRARHDRVRNCRNRAQDDLPPPGSKRQTHGIYRHRRCNPERIGSRQSRADRSQLHSIEGDRQKEQRAGEADYELYQTHLHICWPCSCWGQGTRIRCRARSGIKKRFVSAIPDLAWRGLPNP